MAKTSAGVPRNGPALPFAQALAAWDDSRLTKLLITRPDLGCPPPKTLAALVERSTNWMSIHQCRSELDRGAQQVLDAVCLIPEPKALTALVAMLGGTGRELSGLDDALARLEERALVLRFGDDLVAAPGLAGLQNPARLGPPAVSALASYHAAALTAMARKLGVRPGGTRASALAAVCGAITDPERLDLVMRSGPADCARIARLAAFEGPLVTARNGVYALSDRNPAGWLASHGVLAPMSWDTLVMPREVALTLRGGTPFPNLELAPPETRSTTVDPAAVDHAAAERALRVVTEVRTVLDMWGQVAPAVLKDGGIGVREVRRAAKAIDLPEAGAALVIELAASAGLVTPARPGGVVLPLPAYDQWLAMEVPQRWEHLVRGWLEAGLHPSLAGALDHREKLIPPLLDRSPERYARDRRGLVLGVLAGAPIGEAVTAASLGTTVDWSGPELWTGGPASSALLRSWVMVEAEALGVAALGALSSFGRLAVQAWTGSSAKPAGPAPAPGPGAGAAALAPWAPPVSTNFVLQADLTAVAPGELTSRVRAELELLADVESKGAATVYRFSEASIRRGFDAGRTSERIMDFLGEHASRGVPQALAYLVGDLGRRFGSLRVGGAGCYVRSDDPALISEILAARRNAKLGLRRLAPTVLVSAGPPASTLAALRSAGYLPALEGGEGELVIVDVAPQRASTPRRPWAHTNLDPASVISALRKASGSGKAGSPKTEAADGLGWPHEGLALPPGLSGPTAAALVELFGGMWQPGADRKGNLAGNEVLAEIDAFAERLVAEDAEVEARGAAGEGPPRRPSEIVKGAARVLALFEQAYDEDWMVRLAYNNGNGRPSQLNCILVALDEDAILVECEPGWDERSLVPQRIVWARVLTEAEEEILL